MRLTEARQRSTAASAPSAAAPAAPGTGSPRSTSRTPALPPKILAATTTAGTSSSISNHATTCSSGKQQRKRRRTSNQAHPRPPTLLLTVSFSVVLLLTVAFRAHWTAREIDFRQQQQWRRQQRQQQEQISFRANGDAMVGERHLRQRDDADSTKVVAKRGQAQGQLDGQRPAEPDKSEEAGGAILKQSEIGMKNLQLRRDGDDPKGTGQPPLVPSLTEFSKPNSTTTTGTIGRRSSSKLDATTRRRQQLPVLTIYAEPRTAFFPESRPLPRRRTSASILKKYEFPELAVTDCPDDTSSRPILPRLPVNDDFPGDDDPFLPWIHDYFVSGDGAEVRFIAQNRRRCETGEGKEGVMRYYEPQVALFQPVAIAESPLVIHGTNNTETTTTTIVQRKLSTPADATHPETRFICRFHSTSNINSNRLLSETETTTYSAFPFNYEFVHWRKRWNDRPMFRQTGKDVDLFEFSTLLWSCPIPDRFRSKLVPGVDGGKRTTTTGSGERVRVWLDVIPIRTPARYDEGYLLTQDQIGPYEYNVTRRFDTIQHYGTDHVLPALDDSGRWANLPLCPAAPASAASQQTAKRSISTHQQKQHQFVACTWASASYNRRGDANTIDDTASRVREWLVFHRMVGLDHMYLYDNTEPPEDVSTSLPPLSPLRGIADEFPDFVTYIPWNGMLWLLPFACRFSYQSLKSLFTVFSANIFGLKATVCNNNRPVHKNPGERSSQYAAEASCRERFGPTTEWMAFIDVDEYLVPMRGISWHPILEDMEKRGDVHVLKMRSSRGRPRGDLMEVMNDPDGTRCRFQSHRRERRNTDPCLVPRRNETFLRVYNCDYIKPPRPERFERAMKQIYRPAFVPSHFVHYSTVTSDMARYFKDRTSDEQRNFTRMVQDIEW